MIRQETDYPNSGVVKIHLKTDRQLDFPVHLRIPRWCPQAEARVNGGSPTNAAGGTVLVLNRRWGDNDTISLRMPMSSRWIKGRQLQAGRAVLMRGPVVFCLSKKRNTALKKIDIRGITLDPRSIDGPVPDNTVRPDGMAFRIKGWSPGQDLSKAADLDLLLTEFPDPGGEAVYFLLSDNTIAVDDELLVTDLSPLHAEPADAR
jgi:hypothetical protein